MNLNDIRAFVAVADSGSVSGAAVSLRITQSAVSRRIQSLEAALDAVLLDRQARPPALTPAGRVVLGRCRSLLTAADELKAIASNKEDPVGDLRVGVAHGIVDVTLNEPIDTLRRQYPRLRLHVSSDWSGNLIKQALQGDLDVAVVRLPKGKQPPDGLIDRIVGHEELSVISARSQRMPRALALTDLGAYSWVLHPEGCGFRVAIERALRDAGVPFHVAVDVFSPELLMSLVSRNVGLGLVPDRWLATGSFGRKVKRLNVVDFNFGVSVHVLRRELLGPVGAAVARFESTVETMLAKTRNSPRARRGAS